MRPKNHLAHWAVVTNHVRRFIAGEISYEMHNETLRGPITKVELEEEYLTFFVAWTASCPNDPTSNWKIAPTAKTRFRFWLPSDTMSLPRRKRGRVVFSEGKNNVVIYPNNDRELLERYLIVGL